MKNWFLNNLLIITGVLAGALGGFLYWKFIGCNSGSCIISSKPLNSTLYFGAFGGILFSTFRHNKNKDNE